MQKVGLIYKEEDRLIANTAKKLIKELRGKKYKVETTENGVKKANFVITLGGDGTTLRAARLLFKEEVPILSVHMGGLGLLTEIELSQLSAALEKIRNKNFKIDSRHMIEATVYRKDKKIDEVHALNDVVICKSEISRTIKLEAYLKNRLLAKYVSDGLIISTPTGSTAYNFAVMGPIFLPHARAMVLSPICPHRSADRSIVLHEEASIIVKRGKEVVLTVDGQELFRLKEGDLIKVRISNHKSRFIRFRDYDLFALMREKLGWS